MCAVYKYYSRPSVENTILKDSLPVKDNVSLSQAGTVPRRICNMRRGINLKDTFPAYKDTCFKRKAMCVLQ